MAAGSRQSGGLAEQRGVGQYAIHGQGPGEKVVGRVIGKGLAGDEMGERLYLVVDGVDGRVHHMEFPDPARIEEVRPGMIVEAAPAVFGPRPSDRNISIMAERDGGLYQPSRHVNVIRDSFERQGKDPEAFVRAHVRRLEALRRAGHVERVDAEHWRIPKDLVEQGMAYDLSKGGDGPRVHTLSTLSLEQQIASDGATWLDRELVASARTPLVKTGFGGDVAVAMDRRAEKLVEMGHATDPKRRVLSRTEELGCHHGAPGGRTGWPGNGEGARPHLPAGQGRRLRQRHPRGLDGSR